MTYPYESFLVPEFGVDPAYGGAERFSNRGLSTSLKTKGVFYDLGTVPPPTLT